jgi:hypothetical protein
MAKVHFMFIVGGAFLSASAFRGLLILLGWAFGGACIRRFCDRKRIGCRFCEVSIRVGLLLFCDIG